MRSRPTLVLLGLAAIPLVVLGLFFVLPVVGMVSTGFFVDGAFAPGEVADVLTRGRTLEAIGFTVWTSAVATVVAVALGLPAAYSLYRLNLPARHAIRAALLVPFVLPTVVVGVAFGELIGSAGPLGFLGLDGTPVAILGGLVFFNVAVVIRSVGSTWESLDRRPAEAAAALGATPRQVFSTVTWPQLRPAIVSSASVVFLFCATSFGVVLTLGGTRYASVETEIYLLTANLLDLPAAAALSIVQLLAVVALLVVVGRLRRTPDATLTRMHLAPARPRSGDVPFLLGTTLLGVFIAAPILALVLGSLRRGEEWTLANYADLTTTGSNNALVAPVTDALLTSLRTAVDATWISLALGLLVALAVTRPSRSRAARRTRSALDGFFMLPLGVSAVTVGFGFLITLDEPPLDLRDSALLVPIAQALVALPLVVRTIVPVLASIDDRQRQAAASLGAGVWHRIRVVEAPVLARPLLAAAGFAFAVSLGEFGATAFLARQDAATVPVVIFRLIGRPGADNYGMALAASVVLAACTAAVMLAVERLRVRSLGGW